MGTDANRDATLDAHASGPTGAGCGKAAPQVGDFHLQTPDKNGTSRDYEVIVPIPYEPNTPLALTFVYHGAGQTQAAAKGFGLQNAPGAPAASIFVFPQGIAFQTDGIGWDDRCSGYDMVFFDHMLSFLTANYCVAEKNVFAAGFSWGCDYVTGLTCCRGSRLRAVAAASCSDDFGNTADYKTYINEPCGAPGTTGIRFTHDANGDGAYTAQDFATTAALYRSFDSCSAASTQTALGACVSYQACTEPFLECRYPGLGHTLPPSWANETWSFFSAFP
jgi:poly(3-hydroxybutyrate) depolymerase